MVVATNHKAKVAQELQEAGARIEELEAELEEAKAHEAGLKAKLDYFEGGPAAGKEAQRPSSSRRYELPEESDDEELVPECFKLKQEKQADIAPTDHATQNSAPVTEGRRKRAFSVSELSESLFNALDDDDLGLEMDVEMPMPAATREEPAGKKARRHSPVPSQSLPKTATPKTATPNTAADKTAASKTTASKNVPPRPTARKPQQKPQTPSVSNRSSTDAWLAKIYQYTPNRQEKDDAPTAKSQAERKSNSSKSSHQSQAQTNRKNSTPTQQHPTLNTQRESIYAEMTPFTFKFIVSYSVPRPRLARFPSSVSLTYHASGDMADVLPDFWSRLNTLLDEWETLAGADWAWDLQKPDSSNRFGKRSCVASKLAGLQTKWRAGDEGFFACQECAMVGKPCFTWVEDEDAKWVWEGEGEGEGESEEEGLGEEPKGEFWCLPVHVDDRRNVVQVDKEIWIWVNEGVEGGEEGEGEGEEGAWDEWREAEESDDGSSGSSDTSSSSSCDGEDDD